MRYIVLALGLCFVLSPIDAMAAGKPAKVKVKRSKYKAHKPKKIKPHPHGH